MNTDYLDHSVTITRDYDTVFARYEQLGFTLSPLSRHKVSVAQDAPVTESCTGNRCAYFGKSYLEIIGIVDPDGPDPWHAKALIDGKYEGVRGLPVFHVGTTSIQWVTTGYLLALGVAIPMTGWATVPFLLARPSTSYVVLGAALVVRGGALSAANTAITAAAFTRLASEDVPSGAAVVRLLQQLGGSAGTAVLASLAAGGFHGAFRWSIALTAVALVPAFVIPGRVRA